MVAVSRFVEFSVAAQTLATGASADSVVSRGSYGFSRGTGLGIGDDTFTITNNVNDQLQVTINGVGSEVITLTSGIDLDPRFVARDIEFRLHQANSADPFRFAQCKWRNGNWGVNPVGPNTQNSFIIYTGQVGSNIANNLVSIASPGSRDARATLGFDTVTESPGVNLSTGSSYTGSVTVSGAYAGQFDDQYMIMMSDNETVGAATGVGGPAFNANDISTGGLYTNANPTTYTLVIDTTNGSTMGAGSGNVPRLSWTASPVSDSGGPIELLYADYWYDVGTNGLRVKFADGVFNNNDQFQIACTSASLGSTSPAGGARYIFDSFHGDSSKSLGTGSIAVSQVGTQVGSKGITVAFSNSGTFTAGEVFFVTARGPQPLNEPTTQLNFGNVTVSTNSPVKSVWFEIIGGAVSMSTVKFSLQSDGTFQHHDQGNNDTEFRFGTAGAGNRAPGSGPTSNNQAEFPVDSNGQGRILATDIDSNISPNFLAATVQDLAVVSSADNAEDIGNFQGGLVSDFIWLAIKLGASETGSNSSVNYRVFFDFS